MHHKRRGKRTKVGMGRERTIQILKMVAVGALIVGMGAAPSPRAMSQILRELTLGDTRENRRYVSNKIRRLKKQGYLAQNGVRFAVSDKGHRILSAKELEKLHIPRPARWNGKWYMVMFDIPLEASSARKALNNALIDLGLVQYQQSVLIYPYPIKETVLHICRFHKITRYVSFAIVDYIDGEDKLKKHFKINS